MEQTVITNGNWFATRAVKKSLWNCRHKGLWNYRLEGMKFPWQGKTALRKLCTSNGALPILHHSDGKKNLITLFIATLIMTQK